MLSKDQIAYLFKFCEKHFVYYYDVQTELVDHLSSAIEAAQSENPKLSFEDALDKVYSGFGVMGFAPIVQEKQHLTFRKAKSAYFKSIKDQFRWPQILKFMVFASVIYSVIEWDKIVGTILMLTILFYGIASNLFYITRLNRLVKRTGKKFVAMNFQYQNNLGFPGLYFLGQLIIHTDSVAPSVYSLIVAAYLILFIAADKVTANTKDQLINEYPDIFGPAL